MPVQAPKIYVLECIWPCSGIMCVTFQDAITIAQSQMRPPESKRFEVNVYPNATSNTNGDRATKV